jgi:hypothetical protein
VIEHAGFLGYGMLGKRYLTTSESCAIMICRDADNLLTEVDAKNVNFWIEDQVEPIFSYKLRTGKYNYLGGGIGFRS